MPDKKIVVITDMDSNGSGYRTLCVPILEGLAKMGYRIKVSGFNYHGEEHDFPFSIIPAGSFHDAHAVANNLSYVWKDFPDDSGVDVFIVAMDIPYQNFFFTKLQNLKRKYIAITPMENGPLVMSWAATLINMDAVFFISELGKVEAQKAGVSKADHLKVGIDTVSWHPPTPDERKVLRDGLGLPQDAFVIFTSADNQERKNLWAAMEAVKRLKEGFDRPIRHMLLTRKETGVGWKLDDLTLTLGTSKETQIYNRGLPQKDLWALYAAADVFLLTSKAEGFGLPVLEAMACGLPVVATDTGALHELLEDNRGFLVPPEYTFYDVWGNSRRDMIDIDYCAKILRDISDIEMASEVAERRERALKYAQSRTTDIPVQQMSQKIEEIFDEPK